MTITFGNSSMVMGDLNWRLENTYSQLPGIFYTLCRPTPVRDPKLVIFNHPLAHSLGLTDGSVDEPSLLAALDPAFFTGNALPARSTPLAQAYAGHQFGGFTILGDGRAVLVGEQVTESGQRFDIQFKGSGPTPYSRRGDGRAALGPMLREYLISEAMHALGIATTRGLAVASTGEPVFRQATEPGAVLTRVAASHIRVGTFQYAAARQDKNALQALVDYVITRHYPDLAGGDVPALALLNRVVQVQADLLVNWMRVGFIHGVMNTDNMSICGETIDYGPCAFMDNYDPATVFSSIDHQGRYAFGNQPGMAQWNLLRLAEALLPLLDDDEDIAIERAKAAVGSFAKHYEQGWFEMMRGKLGLLPLVQDDAQQDRALIDGLLAWMQTNRADYTNTFRDLSLGSLSLSGLYSDKGFTHWHQQWQARLIQQYQQRQQSPQSSQALMQTRNPAYIPRNHLVEAALKAGATGDMGPFNALLTVLLEPYREQSGCERYQQPDPSNVPHQTFCGT
jgi:serine/tyrosine/threonine adenylyltransferase